MIFGLFSKKKKKKKKKNHHYLVGIEVKKGPSGVLTQAGGQLQRAWCLKNPLRRESLEPRRYSVSQLKGPYGGVGAVNESWSRRARERGKTEKGAQSNLKSEK